MFRLGWIVWLVISLNFLPIAFAHYRYESLLQNNMLTSEQFVDLEMRLIDQALSPRLILELLKGGSLPIFLNFLARK